MQSVTEHVDYEISTFISHLFTDEHFHLEMCELTMEDIPHIYQIYLQGYIVPSWQGIFYAKHFFDLINNQIDDTSESIESFYFHDDYCLHNPRYPVPPELDSAVLFPDHPQEPIWQAVYTHPVYTKVFKFRFLVTSFRRTLPREIRHTKPFRAVVAQCIETAFLLYLPLSFEPNAFLRSLEYWD